jgi:hypothetical protein
MKPLVPMRAALSDPDLFGVVFAGESWSRWRILLIAAMGEALTDSERAVFKELTGRNHETGQRVDEFWAIVGRRGGKSRAIAVLAAYLACLVDYQDILAPGERASVLVMSASVWQAGKILQYLNGVFNAVSAFRGLVEASTDDGIKLNNHIDLEIRAASFRTSRGGTSVAAICDEIAFWRNEATANPDSEILASIRPSLATTNGLLCAISSPYARRGELYQTYRRDFGDGGDPAILVAKAASRTMNPLLPEAFVARAYARDPVAAAAEFGGDFRTDVESFIGREAVDAAVAPGRLELPPIRGENYIGFVDPSGGSVDAFTLAIAHEIGERFVVDLVREVRPPFSPEAVAADFAETLKDYRVYEVFGDRYAGEWPREQFRRAGVDYVPSERVKSDIYRDLLPLINSGRVELPDNQRLIAQLTGLERRTARGGKDSIDHAPGGHDDLINAVAGAVVTASGDGTGFNLQTYIKAYAT